MQTRMIVKGRAVLKPVLLVAAHEPFRRDLATFLQLLDADYRVEGSVDSGAAALALLDDNEGFVLVLLDIDLPDENGLDLVRHIHQRCPALPVVALGDGDPSDYGQASLAAGARAYVVKLQLVATMPRLLDELFREESEKERKPPYEASQSDGSAWPSGMTGHG